MPKIIIDFDYTLFNTGKFRKDLAKTLGLTSAQWLASYNKIKEQYRVYDYKKHLKLFNAVQQKNFIAVIKKAKKYLYKDSLSFLNKYSKKYQVIILSKGNKQFQELKIKHSGLNKYQIIITNQDKLGIMKKLAKKSKLIFINDRGQEIDEIKSHLPEVRAIWVKRRGSLYFKEPCKLYDKKISNLIINL